jgi:hypothetical protein
MKTPTAPATHLPPPIEESELMSSEFGKYEHAICTGKLQEKCRFASLNYDGIPMP